MKKLRFLFLLTLILFLFWNCDDSISPKGDLPDKYSTSLILRGDTTTQIAYVAKIYSVEGTDPYANENDPAINDAVVSLKYSDSDTEYYLIDTTNNSEVNARYNTPAKYYFINNFPIEYDKTLELSVKLSNGEELTSSTVVPNEIIFDDINTLRFYPGPLIGRDTVSYKVKLADDIAQPDLAKAYKTNLVYYYREDDGTYTKHVRPIQVNNIGDMVEYSFSNYALFNRKILENALAKISEGDPQKGRYLIAPLQVEVFTFDENLTKYYLADLYFNIGLTLQNNPSDLSNISNGYGYFAIYTYGVRNIGFDPQFILNNYGYLAPDSLSLNKR